MVTGCATQLRFATVALPMGGACTRPVGLDYGVAFTMAAALEVDVQLLARVLPEIEAAMLGGEQDDVPDDEEVSHG